MAVKAARKKNPAAVAPGRKGNDPAAKTEHMGVRKSSQFRTRMNEAAPTTAAVDTSDQALLTLLTRLRATNDPIEVRQLSSQLERVIFHKQFKNA